LLRQDGRRYHHPLLILIVRANGTSTSRFGFSAGRQVGKATVRNRAKRLMREHVRQTEDAIAAGWDCLFIARRGAGEASLGEMSLAISHVLARAHLLPEMK